ncbi:hypothetical protein [Altererythrobacter sp. MF3-039]|uniref:hypothetical protein n=1 Tax=Altererythrobacter sp. MF3-039 TaxID=3252901 RepID=UPI00390C7100
MTSPDGNPSRRRVLGSLAAATAGAVGASGSSKTQTNGGTGAAASSEASYRAPVPASRARSVADKLSERMSVLDFNVDPSGKRDSTAGFVAALREPNYSEIYVPEGRYRISQLGVLGAAGKRLIGASRFRSTLLVEPGSGPVLFSEVADRGTTSFHLISDLTIDLQGSDRVAIDLSSVNMTTLQRVHVRGCKVGVAPCGTGVRFAAPLSQGSYDNSVYDCSFENLAVGAEWAAGANHNSIYNCRTLNCDIGFHVAPSGRVDSPRIFGGRAEGCRIGLLEGASQGSYFGIRFEGSGEADIRFTPNSLHALVSGGLTAASNKVIVGLELANSPTIDAGDLGYWAVEESTSRPRVVTGRNVFGAAGKAPALPTEREFAAYFADYVVFADHILPAREVEVDLGHPNNGFRNVYLKDGVVVSGRRVLGPRQRGIARDDTKSPNSDTVNAILAALRKHGLIDG